MGIYGLEEQFWVGDYQFDVGFSNDNDVGLNQRDVYVGKRRKVEDLTLADFTGSQLLQAYCGPDAEQRRQDYTHSREALVTSYKEARRAPHANGTRLLRHEKRDLKRLEKALAQELCGLSPSLFDLSRVQGQVQHTESYHFLRAFYFHEAHSSYIHHFCRKYATDAAYRASVEQGTAPWVECNALFVKNLTSHLWQDLEGLLLDEDDEGYFERVALAEEQFFHWICQHAKQLLADPVYHRLRAHEQASEHTCAQGRVDPEMQKVVAVWSSMPGVVVSKSCQGASGVCHFEGKALLVPSKHEEGTMLQVVSDSQAIISAIGETVAEFPHICLGHLARPLGPFDPLRGLEMSLRSENVWANEAVRADFLRVAAQVKARVLP